MQYKIPKPMVFNDFYAYNRVKALSAVEDIPDLSEYMDYPPDPDDEDYAESGGSNDPNGFWHNYPRHIAVLNTAEDVYMLQTYVGNKKDKCFKNIEGCEKEIREYFEKNKGDVVLLENNTYARQIKPDYESLVKFLEGFRVLARSAFRCKVIAQQCNYHVYDIKKCSRMIECHQNEETVEILKELADSCYGQIMKISEMFKKLETIQLDACVEKISDEEAYGVIFALFYKYYLEGKAEGIEQQTLKAKFNFFVKKHPESIDYFIEHLAKGRFTKKEILAELEENVYNAIHYDALADKILG